MATPGYNDGDNKFARKARTAEQLADRRARAMRCRLEGKSWTETAKAVGVSIATAREDVKGLMAEFMREHEADTIPKYRAMELQRLDSVLAVAYKIIGDRPGTELALKAADRVLRAINLRAELLGLKVPVEVNLRKVEVTQQDLELEELVREAQARAEIQRQTILEEEAAADGGSAAVA